MKLNKNLKSLERNIRVSNRNHIKTLAKYTKIHQCFTALQHNNDNNVNNDKNNQTKKDNKHQNNKFKFDQKEIELNEQQMNIVHEELDKNILIIACAGSGKTTTIICRIYNLLQQGVNPKSIVLTTFTRDATNDMKKKIEKMFGRGLPLEIGTIDSISRRNLLKYTDAKLKNVNVGEYSIRFLRFLQNHPDRNQYFCDKKYLFVDEFQDINDIQSNIISEFYKNGCNIVAVGDDAQNIYSFRGSNIDHILNFDKKYDNVRRHKLILNYRSTPEIVKLANESIEKNTYQIPKKMVPFNKSIENMPSVTFYHSWRIQNVFIKDKIQYYINKGIPKHEIAILSRTKYPLYSLEEILTKNKIPNVYLDGEGDIRTKIKDDHICMSTIHKSKGLEWKVVFIINLNDNSFPSGKTAVELEEERRLFYVAVTRAKKYLHLSFYPNYNSSFVSRFISELDEQFYNFTNYNRKYIGISEEGVRDNKLSVTELIRNLDGMDYMVLRDKGILPELDFDFKKIFDSTDYEEFIKENDLYSDFGIFIDCLICRMLGEIDPESNGLLYEPALLAIANVKLSTHEYNIYKKYKTNFVENLDKVKLDDIELSIFHKLENIQGVDHKIAHHHKETILNIIEKLFDNSTRFNVPFYKIPIFSERFLPEDFEKKMEKDLQIFTNSNNNYKDIIKNVWEISKCNKIVNDGRRRLLYKDFNLDNLMNYNKMYTDVHNKYVKVFSGIDDKKCHYSIKLKDVGVFGEIDLYAKRTVIDFKTSSSGNIDASWILQVLCYAYLLRSNNEPVNKIQIFNPLKGTIHTASIKKWNRGSELITYLLEKRKKLLERTKMLKVMQYQKADKTKKFKEKINKKKSIFENMVNKDIGSYLTESLFID
jgi:hypothetical protein